MEIENEENKMEIEEETNDITANQLIEKIESWNQDIKKSFSDKKDKKENKEGYKLKDLLIKFNKFPTPIKDVELIDIKLGSKIKEDDIFLEKDFVAKHLRRGESFFYNKSEGTYDYARIGLPKFFDYKKKYEETQNDIKLKERVLGEILEISKTQKNNIKYMAYLTTKVNGENFQVSYNTKYDCWVIASKNVSMVIRNKEDIEFYKNENNFKDYLLEENAPENQIMTEKEKKMKEKKDKKLEKKKKKQERIERRKKGKNDENKKEEDKEDEEEENDKEEKKEDEKEENQNKINTENKNDKKDKEKKGINNILERYTYAIDFAETWLKILEERIINKNLINEFKTELGNHTLIGESVGDKKREHILVYKERDIIFYGIVNNQKLLSQKCMPLSKSYNLFKKYNLSLTESYKSNEFENLEELFNYINEQFDVIFDKSLQESGEGNVVYLSCNINGNESVKGLAKLKTFEYRFYRKIREKCKGVFYLKKEEIERDITRKFNEKKKKKDKKKEKKKKEKNDEENNNKNSDEEENKALQKLIDKELKIENEKIEKRINSLIKKMINESKDLLKEVPKSKYNLDKNLLNEYFDLGEYIIKYRAKDKTNYFDVFASYIEVMKEKFKEKAEINDSLINEIRKKFEGLISNSEEKEDEDQKE